jgi:O-antigen/teichoic acid export membrane protein
MTKTKLVFSISSVTGLHVMGILASLVAVPMLIRLLGVEEFGRYLYWLSVFTLFGMIISFGVENVQLHQIARSKEKVNIIVSQALGVRIYPLITSMLLFSLFALWNDATNLILISFVIYATAAFTNLNWLQYGLSNTLQAAIVEFLAKMMFLLMFFLVASTYEQAILIFALSQFVASIIFFAFWLQHKPKNVFSILYRSKKYNRDNVNVVVASTASLPLNQLIPIVTMNVFGPVFVGNFGVMEKIASAIKSLYVPASKVITPKITRKLFYGVSANWLVLYAIIFVTPAVILVVMLNFFSTEILNLVSGNNFHLDYGLFFNVYTMSIPVVVLITFFGANILLGIGQSKAYRTSSIVGSAYFLLVLVYVYWSKSITMFFIGIISADLLILTMMIVNVYRAKPHWMRKNYSA